MCPGIIKVPIIGLLYLNSNRVYFCFKMPSHKVHRIFLNVSQVSTQTFWKWCSSLSTEI